MPENIRRAFVDLSEKEVEDAETAELLLPAYTGRSADWDDILKSRLVLVFSEAQSGKTYECQSRQQLLWASGEAAFFVELAAVASQPWRDLLSPAELDRLDRWRRTEADIATVFLDSVDELRLTQNSFRAALRHVARELDGHMARTRIVLTSRPLPVDRALFLATFAAPRMSTALTEEDFASRAMGERRDEKEDRPPEVRYVSLLPLQEDAVLALARNRGVVDTDAFLCALASSSMLDFMRRPQDVIEAASAWIELRGKFGTHREQVLFDVRGRLRPNPERADRPLKDTRAFEGAKRLALAVVLTRRLNIRHDVNRDTGDPATAIDPAVILSDWDSEERVALLERGLFGFASYGRVRFHNRLAFEFLAAERLGDFLDAGQSLRAVRRLLEIRTAQGFAVIRPSMRDTAAWLASRDNRVFARVKELDPALLMQAGDPGSLTGEQKRAVLLAYIEKYGKGGWRGLSVPQVQIRRMADPCLAPIVTTQFGTVENPEVRHVLLALIEQGRLRECAEIPQRVIRDPDTDHNEKYAALDALIALRDPGVKSLTASLTAGPEPWDHRFARMAIYRLFPENMSVAELTAILTWIEVTEHTGSELSRMLLPRIEQLDPTELEAFRAIATGLVESGLSFNATRYAAQNDRPHLVAPLSLTCALLLEAGVFLPAHAASVALVSRLASGPRANHDVLSRLAAALATASPTIRSAVFVQEVALTAQLHRQRSRFDLFFHLNLRGLLEFTHRDAEWVRGFAADTSTEPTIRTTALSVEVHLLARGSPQRHEMLAGLRALVSDDDDLLAYLDQQLQPHVESKDAKKIRLCDEKQRRQQSGRHAKDKASWVMFWRSLQNDPDEAFSEARGENTAYHLWQAMGQGGAWSRCSGWDRQLIEQHLGRAIADRLRSRLRPVWRRESPTLPSERPTEVRNTVFVRWVFALAAIAAEAEDPDWAKRLTAEEAEIAVRHAPLNASNFPAWLDALAVAHPETVDQVLGREMSWSLTCPAAPNAPAMILQDVHHASLAVARLFLPRLRTWLQVTGGAPTSADDIDSAARRLEQVLAILLKFGCAADRAAVREAALVGLVSPPHERLSRVWLPTLFSVDPAAAVDWLERLCADVDVSDYSGAVAWFAELFGGRHLERAASLRQPGMTPGLLVRLLRLAYRHVERGEDAMHDGSYQPDIRDDAETGRNMVLNALIDLGGPEGWAAKLEIANDPAFAHLRDRLRLLAVEKSAAEADSQAMRPADVVKLDRTEEPGPRSPAEMFAVMTDRLDDLRDHLLSDASPRELWASTREERVLRRAIAEFLETHACGAYSVEQESVTGEEKETDIRLRSTAVTGIEGVIELKVGDKDYSANELKAAISDQLVKKYLAADGRRAGVLVVTRAQRTKWIEPATKAAMDFGDLIALLKAEAAQIQNGFPAETHLDAAGLDLKPRLEIERKTKARSR